MVNTMLAAENLEPSVLLALADRCEKEEPNRILDALVEIAADKSRPAWAHDSGELTVDGDCVRLSPTGVGWFPSHYTTSLDAAATLVPKDWRWLIRSDSDKADDLKPFARVSDAPLDTDKHFYGRAATPALALCVAALRALAGSKDHG